MPSRGLLEDSPHRIGYSAISTAADTPAADVEVDQRTLEEAAAAMRDRLPGRSRKAKGRFRRQQREKKGDQWRGRLTAYCEASSYDLEKLTSKLKEERRQEIPSRQSKLYSTRWRVKAHFDVLHLHGHANRPILNKSSSFRDNNMGAASTPTNQQQQFQQHMLQQQQQMPDAGYHTYDTEVSDTEIGGTGGKLGALDMLNQPDLMQQDIVTTIEDDTIDILLFSWGPVLFWGFNDEIEERATLSDLRQFVDGTFHDPRAAEDAMEEMEFTYRDVSRIMHDIVELSTFKSGEKLSVSSAVAQSCLLSVHEWRLGQTIGRNNHIPKELAETGMINMSGDAISKEIGRLFVERNLINLEPELLE